MCLLALTVVDNGVNAVFGLLADARPCQSRGESAASALEANLTNLENKLDNILASLGIEAGGLDDEEEEEEQKGGKEEDKKKTGGEKIAVTKDNDDESKGKGQDREAPAETKATTDEQKGLAKKTEG